MDPSLTDGSRRRGETVAGSLLDPVSRVLKVSELEVVRDGVHVLDGINWEIFPGERWVIVGPNGSGKTTLLKVVGSRLWPTRGDVEILGCRLGTVDMRTLRSRIALVSNSVIRQLRPGLSAREVVVTGLNGALETWWHEYRDQDWEEADRLLDESDMRRSSDDRDGGVRSRVFGVMSEGERQRVLLARALMGRPDLMLFDEPAAGLDIGARELLVKRLRAIATDPSKPPFVLVTHHLEEIPPGVTHGVLMRGGRFLCSGRLNDVMTSQAVSDCFEVDVEVGEEDGRWWTRAIL